ncbi:MAG: hypothetical protein QF858_01740 [Candidatus Pacebacteria bacterium]|jgi:hypothetical protein|nr:hypothetical protein [bacterium]MDP6527585.1 hypothetical protein [Candidatus Paceibacterota bacterium]MDP6659559.1 hypothetical protein [Candidatus Paceibacterota bacterium]|tara:strand:- start:55555 stop:55821 length:267 start_codon:yes stop_codon:yes gene_type:complete
MSKDSVILILGIVVVIVPFLGFPGIFETIAFVVSGAVIAVLAFMLRRDIAEGLHCKPFEEGKTTDTYSQNNARKNDNEENAEKSEGEG